MFSVFIGVIIGIIEIFFTIIFLTKKWFFPINRFPIWNKNLFIKAPNKFFLILIILYAISPLLGGIITGFFAKNAKKAYAILTGFILFFIVLFHIFFYQSPVWFKIIVFPISFYFSYLGGNFIEFLQKKKWIN
ncbi:hypothetical protein [Blattabacterium cuenoti]|uniref:hypothetical protein n=1 Tax=Blattabacterium cuenoti TaxID=1653831 RepID=UPI001EEB7F2D|nr:hypothetical protein [Blattabacterium cuenoti]